MDIALQRNLGWGGGTQKATHMSKSMSMDAVGWFISRLSYEIQHLEKIQL
jgi:hypothetical protein